MPSKRRNTRTAQLHPQAASDYDTDTANVTDAAPDMDPPRKRTNTELNLAVLRRYSPDIERIVAIAPFAVIYTFSPETQQWEKCGIEGTLFISTLSRGGYNVLVLNRKSLDNFITELTDPDDVEITEEYVILQVIGEDGTPQIYGLWIFSEPESQPSTREEIAQRIQSCARQAQIAKEMSRAEERFNGQQESHSYGPNGDTHSQQMQGVAPTSHSQNTGQKLDLSSLFIKPTIHPAQPRAERDEFGPLPPSPTAQASQPARFTSTADTEFFRSSHSPAIGHQQQRAPSQTQQNVLLGLLKK